MATFIEVDTALSLRDYSTDSDNTVCLVIDVIRASSTIVSLFDNGCRRVYTVAEEEKARQLGRERKMLTSGEWQGIKLPGFDLDNSPAEARTIPVRDRDVVLCTSNGTRVIDKARIAAIHSHLLTLEIVPKPGGQQPGRFLWDPWCAPGSTVKAG